MDQPLQDEQENTKHPLPRAEDDGAERGCAGAKPSDDALVGSHEYRLRDRYSGGSTSQRLLDSPACPLLVLGPGTRDAAR